MLIRLVVLCGLLAFACGGTCADETARLKVTVSTLRPMVGEQVLISIRGEYDLRIAFEDLKIPALAGADWLQLQKDRWSDQMVGGREIKVFERRLGLYANRPGRLTIPPLVQNLTVLNDRGERVQRSVIAQPATLDVVAAPATTGAGWLPASSVSLTDQWSHDPARLDKGSSVRRTVILKVAGADPQRLPSEPSMRAPWLITFTEPEKREMERTPDGPVTTVTWTWQLRPITGEPGTLPPIRVPWYDTASQTAHEAIIGPRRIGYAGFGADSAMQWSDDFQSPVALLATGSLGFILTLSAIFLIFRPRGRDELVAGVGSLVRLLPDRHAVAVRLAARRGDAVALRRATGAYLARRERRSVDLKVLALLDRHLFSADDTAEPFDFLRFRRALLEGRWRSRQRGRSKRGGDVAPRKHPA